MESSAPARPADVRQSRPGAWTSLWIVALISLLGQLALCQFFSFGARIPLSIDVDPSNLWRFAYQFPPGGEFLVLNWLGTAYLPPPMNPFTLGVHLPPWLFFTAFAPVMATLALLAMAAFLRELEISRPAALFGAVIFAWQGDLLSFIFPGHYGYIASWPFYALGAWGALRSQRTGHWAYALVSGACCGIMVGLQPDRGGMACLVIAAIYLAAAWRNRPAALVQIRNLALCSGLALVISLAAIFALFQSFIVGVSLGGAADREETYKYTTQFSLGPEESLTYLVPGVFGWHSNSLDGPYWGRIGQWPSWPEKHEGTRSFNLAISTAGTLPTALALLATLLLLPRLGAWLGGGVLTDRQRFFGRVLLALGVIGLVLAWGYHTPLYRVLFALPLMDKWRDPLKWLELTNFALIVLGALGLQALLGLLSAPEGMDLAVRRRARLSLDFIFILVGIGLVLSFVIAPALTIKLVTEGYDANLIPEILGTMHEAFLFAVVLMFLLCALVRLASNPERLRTWQLENPLLDRVWKGVLQPARMPLVLALAVTLLAAAQLAWVASKFVTSSSLAFLTASNPLVDELKSQGNTVRVSLEQDATLNFLLQNQFVTPEISCLEISAASRYPAALTAFLNALADNPERLWLLAGVKNRVIPEASFAALQGDAAMKADIDHVDGYTLAPTVDPNLPSHALIQLRDYLAKVTFVPGAEILPTDAAQLARLKNPKWDPRATVILSQDTARIIEDARPKNPPPSTVTLQTYNAHRIELGVQSAQSGFILVNDAYDPDWQVKVDGRDTPLLRADYLLRAVPVPGTCHISMTYVAHYRVAGMSLPVLATNILCDLAMLATWIVAGVALWRRRATA